MMTSDYAFVWIWLPNETTPVVAGKLTRQNNRFIFNYGRSYLNRENAIAIYDPELPLQAGEIPLNNAMVIPSCIRDASPDAWGRRVIINRKFGKRKNDANVDDLDELSYLLESGSDRIGALDFQLSATEYVPRQRKNASLEELLQSAGRVEKGVPLTEELDEALNHGTSIGGARPKALIDAENKKYIAKFSSASDTYDVIKGEYIAMRLAAIAGLNVANVSLENADNKDVLLIERFDRVFENDQWFRRSMVSALTLLELDEMQARHASYQSFATIIRHRFEHPGQTLKELFGRIVFNVLSGNTDDHARNHSAFWDGKNLSLTPAYDICPQNRHGGEASQAMLINDKNNLSRITTCLDTAHHFLLAKEDAVELIENMIDVIVKNWKGVCDEASMSEVDRNFYWKRIFMNPYAFELLPEELSFLGDQI